MENKSVICASFKKNDHEKIQVSLNVYKDNTYADIRVFYLSEDGYKPSKTGIMFNSDRIPGVIAGLLAIQEELNPTVVEKSYIQENTKHE
jgi:hypothetical protein